MRPPCNLSSTRPFPARSRRGSAALVTAMTALVTLASCPATFPSALPPELEVTAADHVLGSADAPVTVIEYADLQCPVCKRFNDESFAAIREQYIDTGRVRWVFRHFPLTGVHPLAQAAAEAAECAADQARFWEFHDAVFVAQADLTDALLTRIAADLGLDRAAFAECRANGGKAARVATDVATGGALGVSGTPTFFVSGLAVRGFQTAEQLSAIIDQALAAGIQP
ncbi:Disulfide bond formation protein D precursor [Phycisphaerae bacterium RAS1]|nr:Disulfide bond formation protein D precursor [Phycisphaerae bacterium RAS1]